MTYEFLSIEDAGNRRDDIICLRQHPSWFERLLGHRPDRLVFYGHDNTWHRIDGWKVDEKLREKLTDFWRHQCQPEDELPQPADRQSAPSADVDSDVDQGEEADRVQEALEESFPASDPPSWTTSAI